MRPIRTALRALAIAAIAPPIVILVIVAIAVALPVALAMRLQARRRIRRFRRSHAGQELLVCSSRGGWHELVINNVEPAIPRSLELCWISGRRRDRFGADLRRALHAEGTPPATPFLARIEADLIRTVPLRDALWPLKSRGRRSEAVEAEVAELIGDRLLDLELARRSEER